MTLQLENWSSGIKVGLCGLYISDSDHYQLVIRMLKCFKIARHKFIIFNALDIYWLSCCWVLITPRCEVFFQMYCTLKVVQLTLNRWNKVPCRTTTSWLKPQAGAVVVVVAVAVVVSGWGGIPLSLVWLKMQNARHAIKDSFSHNFDVQLVSYFSFEWFQQPQRQQQQKKSGFKQRSQ